MPCEKLINGAGQVVGWICGPTLYDFDGFLFEWDYFGPTMLNRKTEEPAKRIPDKFWITVGKFSALNEEEKKKYVFKG